MDSLHRICFSNLCRNIITLDKCTGQCINLEGEAELININKEIPKNYTNRIIRENHRDGIMFLQ